MAAESEEVNGLVTVKVEKHSSEEMAAIVQIPLAPSKATLGKRFVNPDLSPSQLRDRIFSIQGISPPDLEVTENTLTKACTEPATFGK